MNTNFKTTKKLVLVSQSPRRRDLLKRAGFQFEIVPVQISEILKQNLSWIDAVEALAVEKAKALVDDGKLLKGHNYLLLSADTVVLLDDEILGKPSDDRQAISHLSRLSGREHQVITGVCLWDLDSGRCIQGSDVSGVQFRKLSEEEIKTYVASGEGRDKAGSYGLQGAAATFVEKVRGRTDTVVGLPVDWVERTLIENAWHVDRIQSEQDQGTNSRCC